MVGVEVGDEDRPHERPAGAVARVDGQPGPPQLTVHPFAAVDEVDGVADDHGVGEAAPAELGVPTATGPEEDHARVAASVRRGARPWFTSA